MSAGHGPSEHGGNKGVALLISVLALVLAFSETLGKGAQTAALAYNIEASNLWAFFQAKTIRQTVLRTAAEQMEVSNPGEAVKKQIAKWKETADRYQSEPETGEGRKELSARAKEAEKKRDTAMAAYHHYELASAAVQIAIVLASASIITSMVALVWLAGGGAPLLAAGEDARDDRVRGDRALSNQPPGRARRRGPLRGARRGGSGSGSQGPLFAALPGGSGARESVEGKARRGGHPGGALRAQPANAVAGAAGAQVRPEIRASRDRCRGVRRSQQVLRPGRRGSPVLRGTRPCRRGASGCGRRAAERNGRLRDRQGGALAPRRRGERIARGGAGCERRPGVEFLPDHGSCWRRGGAASGPAHGARRSDRGREFHGARRMAVGHQRARACAYPDREGEGGDRADPRSRAKGAGAHLPGERPEPGRRAAGCRSADARQAGRPRHAGARRARYRSGRNGRQSL